jgi:hypothetical protein
MLDLHVVSSGGGTGLTAIGTIPANDGASVAGVPIASGAYLIAWGGLTTIADTIKELKLGSQDLIDPINGEDDVTGGTATGIINEYDFLQFVSGARNISMSQNTAGANNLGYTLDYYSGGPVTAGFGLDGSGFIPPPGYPAFAPLSNRQGVYPTTLGVLTAITYGTTAFSPTNAIPAGKWAILGAKVSSLTNYALIRFLHADFGAFSPGFPVVDPNVTLARANAPSSDLMFSYNGYQFAYLSWLLQKPCCPVFTVQANATGLRYQAIAITADTPQVTVNLLKVA